MKKIMNKLAMFYLMTTKRFVENYEKVLFNGSLIVGLLTMIIFMIKGMIVGLPMILILLVVILIYASCAKFYARFVNPKDRRDKTIKDLTERIEKRKI